MTHDVKSQTSSTPESHIPSIARLKPEHTVEWEEIIAANTQDGYSRAWLVFTARWAHLMEDHIAKGASVADCSEATFREANTMGITGYMYDQAVVTLARIWEHGEELRVWHNTKYGLSPTASGVASTCMFELTVNP